MNKEEQGHTLALDYHLNKTHIDETMPTCHSYATCFASILSCLNAMGEVKSWSLGSSRQNKELKPLKNNIAGLTASLPR